MTKDILVKLLLMSETKDIEYPFRCLPPINIDMANIKAERIMGEITKEANEKIKSRWFKAYNTIKKENKK